MGATTRGVKVHPTASPGLVAGSEGDQHGVRGPTALLARELGRYTVAGGLASLVDVGLLWGLTHGRSCTSSLRIIRWDCLTGGDMRLTLSMPTCLQKTILSICNIGHSSEQMCWRSPKKCQPVNWLRGAF
jgi:hypothetical protein